MRRHLIAASLPLLGLLAAPRLLPALQPDGKVPLAQCASGAESVLLVGGVARSPHHDGKDGEADFVLEDKTTHAVLWQHHYTGEGICLGYDAASKRYVVGIKKQQGIGVRLTSLRYIDETRHRDYGSRFNERNMEAFAAVPGPGLRYIALVAMEGNDIFLFALDTEKDVVSKLGEAPLPPPFSSSEHAYALQHASLFKDDKWNWMSSFRDSYMDLDSGMVQFENAGILKVSYGSDTPNGRSPDRRVVKYDLSRLANQNK